MSTDDLIEKNTTNEPPDEDVKELMKSHDLDKEDIYILQPSQKFESP